MKITKRQLRGIIREACGLDTPAPAAPDMTVHNENVPVPADYDAVRDILAQSPMHVDLAIAAVMQAAGASCERSSAQAIIDHLQDMLSPAQPVSQEAPSLGAMIKGPGFA